MEKEAALLESGKENEDLCSFYEDELTELYSSCGSDTCGDGSLDVKSTEVRTANSLEIKGFREFGVNMTGLL